MKHAGWLWLVLGLVIWAAVPAAADARRVWVKQIDSEATWNHYSKRVSSDQLGKFIIDVRTDDIYFIDVNVFNIHADFVLGELLKLPWTADNVREYNKNYERVKPRFILCYLTHHLKIDKWTFSFWEGDKVGPDDVMRVKKRFEQTFFMKDLPFRPDSPMQQAVAADVRKRGLKTITNDEIYKAASFQAFNKGRAVGKLRIVPVGTPFESLTFERTDGMPFDFAAGQWVNLHLPLPSGEIKRAYSIASDPDGSPRFQLAITRVDGGPGSTYLHELAIGARLNVVG